MSVLEQPISSRKLAAILSADIAGYSALMGADEEGTVRKLRRVQEAVLPLVERFGGRIIDLAGDGILAEFPSAVRAVEGAAAIQARMEALNAESEPPMLFRIGVNVGDVIYDGERLYGDGINVAARLQAIAEAGGICISNKVHEEVRDRVGLHFQDIGERKLKNIARPIRAFSVVGTARIPLSGNHDAGKVSSTRTTRKRLAISTAVMTCAAAALYLGSGSRDWISRKVFSSSPNEHSRTSDTNPETRTRSDAPGNPSSVVIKQTLTTPGSNLLSKPAEAAPYLQAVQTDSATDRETHPASRREFSSADLARKESLDRQVARDPSNKSALSERGRLLTQYGEFAPALADFDHLILLDPNDLVSRNNRCWTRALKNDLEQALADCDEVLRQRPTFVDALDSRGLIHLKMGELRAAIADYTTALNLNPKHSSALYGRGLAWQRLGEKTQAQQDFADARSLSPAIDREYAELGLSEAKPASGLQ
jgi:class 3 adenylate cyclase/tetratricopeptide (TPR) repeat protein